ncbi:hypothetical protein [Jeotgalibacillus aurantiacus]|uniref:hypothetical protein n=1 Tax=Jeotgalibacillus aurantiacus TaxID=2763266 RepID=UPI001D09C362|nr:hypothetical protein [Jeotgalibacillus aurantiacus]
MRKWVVTFSMMTGLLMVPGAASAEGLLSSVTNSLSGQEEQSEEQKETSSLLGDTVSSVVETVDETVDPVVKTVEETLPDVKVDAGVAEVDTSEGINVETPVADASVSSDEGIGVETSVADVNVSAEEGVSVDSSVADASVSTDLELKAETPVADANVSLVEGVEVDTSIADASVSLDEGVKVETPVADADVSLNEGIEVSTPVADATVSVEDNIEIETPVADVEVVEESPAEATPAEETAAPVIQNETESNTFKEENKSDNNEQNITPEVETEPVQAASAPVERPAVTDTGFTDDSDVVFEPATQQENDDVRSENPDQSSNFTMPKEATVTASPTFSGGGASSGPANAVGGSATAVAGVLFDQTFVIEQVQISAYSSERLLFDQWLNAPPSQPPKSSSFFANSI